MNMPPATERGATTGIACVPRLFPALGTFGFGGPIALVGHMHRDLVEKRKWVSSEDYVEGLAFSVQLCPGLLAAPLGKFPRWLNSETLGATLTGLAFVLPSFRPICW
jgi:chromate transporter